MKHTTKLIKPGHLLFLLAMLLLSATAAQAKFKCWTNNEGVKECGNAVPPEYAQQGHEVMNKHGVARESKKAKTLEELTQEREAEKAAAAAAVDGTVAAEDRVKPCAAVVRYLLGVVKTYRFAVVDPLERHSRNVGP